MFPLQGEFTVERCCFCDTCCCIIFRVPCTVMQYEYTYSRVSFAYRKMKFLALCLLLAAGSCLAGVSRSNTYSVFYNSLPEECKCVTIRPADGRVYGILCQYSVDRWQSIVFCVKFHLLSCRVNYVPEFVY
jgi:hypothetical protein